MWFKQDLWSGTYYIYRPYKRVELRKNITPKMREIMESVEPVIERNHWKIWREK